MNEWPHLIHRQENGHSADLVLPSWPHTVCLSAPRRKLVHGREKPDEGVTGRRKREMGRLERRRWKSTAGACLCMLLVAEKRAPRLTVLPPLCSGESGKQALDSCTLG